MTDLRARAEELAGKALQCTIEPSLIACDCGPPPCWDVSTARAAILAGMCDSLIEATQRMRASARSAHRYGLRRPTIADADKMIRALADALREEG
jgi:hypothetical protein